MPNLLKLLLLSSFFGCSLIFGGLLPICGDGLQEGKEDCDDGNQKAQDGCDPKCKLEGNAVCGNGATEGNEECDDGDTTNGNGCDSTCHIEFCGDGIINNGEECDDANAIDNDACDNDCRLVVPPGCGDGVLNVNEECDLGPSNSQAPNALCRINCQVSRCGDAIIDDQQFEVCDDGNNNNNDGCDSDCIPTVVTQIAAGSAHTCALLRSGNVRCWGEGDNGRLGYGNTNDIGDNENPLSAGDIDLGSVALFVTAGGQHTCAILVDQSVLCWGKNDAGQLGQGQGATGDIGDNEDPSSLVPLSFAEPIIRLAAGNDHTCALSGPGNVFCWGLGTSGVLGYANNSSTIGDDEPATNASSVDIGGSAIQIVAGATHNCALINDGTVRCWGNNLNGQLGFGNTDNIGDNETPNAAGAVSTAGGIAQLSAGGSTSCALFTAGNIKCWGANNFGQLGQNSISAFGDDSGELPSSQFPIDFALVNEAPTKLDGGGEHSCAVFDTNVVRCWGRGNLGQLGYGNPNNIGDDEVPGSSSVAVGASVVQITAGDQHTCALLTDGRVRCWGNAANGRLGYGNANNNVGDNEPPSNVGNVPVF